MRMNHDTEVRIAVALKQAELGTAVAGVCRKMGLSEDHLLPLETEIRRSGSFGVAAAAAAPGREHQAETPGGRPQPGQGHAAGGAGRKALTPGRRRDLVRHVQDRFGVSERRGCAALRFHRSSQRDRSGRDDQAPLSSTLAI